MKEWVGKKVYVSDESIGKAELHRERKDIDNCGKLVEYEPEQVYPFVVRLGGNQTVWWYAVLSDEETITEPLQIGDRVRVRDLQDAYHETDYTFIAMINNKYAVIHTVDYESFSEGLSSGSVSLWDNAKKVIVHQKKKVTMEEALAKLQEVYGQDIEISEEE